MEIHLFRLGIGSKLRTALPSSRLAAISIVESECELEFIAMAKYNVKL